MSIKILDPHIHLFDLNQGDYFWLQPEQAPFWPDKPTIAKNVNEGDLQVTSSLALAGFVHIEAGFDNQQPWRELDWLEATCNLPFKTVAFADITHKDFHQQLNTLTQRPSLVGIRHILDEQACTILSAKNTLPHLSALASNGLSFDAQLNLTDTLGVEALLACAKKTPHLSIIINHGGWPPFKTDKDDSNRYTAWLQNLHKLATCKNIAIKVSGWEMLDRQWQPAFLHTVLLDCLMAFGRKRVMLASNFPLCQFSKSYNELWQVYLDLADTLDADCFQKISYQNTKDWYQF